MVGVAGRSKACATCKLRHVRCDARRPSCQRCEAGAFTCLGYEKPAVFIDQTNQTKEIVMRLQSKVVRTRSPICPTSEIAGVRVPSSASIYNFHFQSLGVDFRGSFGHQASPYEEVKAFMDKVLLRNYTELSYELNHKDLTDLAVIPMLGTSAESVALYINGKHTQNTTQLHQALQLHGKTLDQLRAVIFRHYNPKPQSVSANAPLLVVVMNMVLYEFIAPTTPNAWKEHVRGLEAMITNYGSAAFDQAPMRQVFEQARMHMVVAHLDDVQRAFLEEKSWQEVPWSHQTEPKSIVNYYIDILCCIPGLLENKNRLSKGLVVDSNTVRRSITRQIFHLYTKLLQVRWLWEVSNPSCCREVPTSEKHLAAGLPVETSAAQPVFQSLLVFSSFQRAIETNLYNCCMLFLCDIASQLGTLENLKQLPTSQLFGSSCNISNLYRSSDSDTECTKATAHYYGITRSPYAHKTNPALAFPHELTTFNLPAYEICRTIEFMLQPNHGSAGAYFSIFPLRVAQLFIDSLSTNESGPELGPFIPGQFTTRSSVPETMSQGTEKGSDANHTTVFHSDGDCVGEYHKTKSGFQEKEESHAVLVSQWARSTMGHIADAYGFSVTRNFS